MDFSSEATVHFRVLKIGRQSVRIEQNLLGMGNHIICANDATDSVPKQSLEEITTTSIFQKQQFISSIGVAVVTAAASTWLQLASASMLLHTKEVGMNANERDNYRRSIVRNMTSSDNDCLAMLRMSPYAFELFCNKLKSTGYFKEYYSATIEEQVVAFLLVVGQNFKNRAVRFFLCRSGETISRYFHNVLNALIVLEEELVTQPNGHEVSEVIRNSSRFFPYFKDCLGAIDGTHVRVKVLKATTPRYRGRKDWPTQNVLAACSFDLRFTYILAGWDGSAADSRVMKSALSREDPLVIPEGKFYLVDAGFGLTSKLITPYGRTRYHLKEYSMREPETPEELFNHRHSSLRNAIERAFGMLKKRFPIIGSGAEAQYSCSTMTDIILACCVFHNFLLSFEQDDEAFMETQSMSTNSEIRMSDATQYHVGNNSTEYRLGEEMRDALAAAMWDDYCVNTNIRYQSN